MSAKKQSRESQEHQYLYSSHKILSKTNRYLNMCLLKQTNKQTSCMQVTMPGLHPCPTPRHLSSDTGFSRKTMAGIKAVRPNRKQWESAKSLGFKLKRGPFLKQTKACPCEEGRRKMVPEKVKIDSGLLCESFYCYRRHNQCAA